jgi:uncharacterized protein YkwD
VIAVSTLLGILSAPLTAPAHAAPSLHPADARCVVPPASDTPSVALGHLYLSTAYQALDRDRARFAGLPALRHSAVLSAVAEAHSAYMASIGSWSDGDPSGDILGRVHAAGLADAVYAGQNVVTANGSTAAEAIRNGEAFFAQEAGGGGPHWDNITNPNHHYVGMGVALLGSAGDYTIYLTQVFSDVGGCAVQSGNQFTQAADVDPPLRIGAIVHPSVDVLQLRSEPQGMVISTLQGADKLKVVDLQGNWAQVEVLAKDLYGWVYAPFLTS